MTNCFRWPVWIRWMTNRSRNASCLTRMPRFRTTGATKRTRLTLTTSITCSLIWLFSTTFEGEHFSRFVIRISELKILQKIHQFSGCYTWNRAWSSAVNLSKSGSDVVEGHMIWDSWAKFSNMSDIYTHVCLRQHFLPKMLSNLSLS